MFKEPQDNLFLQNFSVKGRESLMAVLDYVNFKEGEHLFYADDAADGVYLVLEGRVAIIKIAQNREVVLNMVSAGDYFGEVAVIDGQGRSTGACARTAVKIAKVPKEAVLRVLVNEPVTLVFSLFKKVFNQLRVTNNLFVQQVVHKEKMQLVGEMANALIHDFRNPIAGITVAAANIKLAHADVQTQHWCDIIETQSNRLIDMTRELLEYSRGDARLAIQKTTIHHVTDITFSLLSDYLKQSGVEFVLEVESVAVELDLMRMLRVLQNLINNAVEALGDRPNRKIHLKAWEENQNVILTIADNGPGIPEKIRETLFEPFVTYGKSSGTGLGMAIVKSIIDAHHGTITFESQPEVGTTFTLILPKEHPKN